MNEAPQLESSLWFNEFSLNDPNVCDFEVLTVGLSPCDEDISE